MVKKKIINAHTHVFTGNFVPPFLAKTIVPWPFFLLVNTGWVVNLLKLYFKKKYNKEYPRTNDDWEKLDKDKRFSRRWVIWRSKIFSRWFLRTLFKFVITWLGLLALINAIEILILFFDLDPETNQIIAKVKGLLGTYFLYFEWTLSIKIGFVLVILWLVKPIRKSIYFILKSLFPIFKKVLDKNAIALLERYYLLGRFSLYESQEDVADRARHQLPSGSAIVILPMDMEQMKAGRTKVPKLASKEKQIDDSPDGWKASDFADSYKYQMRELWEFTKNKDGNAPKEHYYPFVFLDPRRVKREGDDFFNWHIVDDKMVLKDCFLKTYMEKRKFSGFKIYPALGYYPFDEYLLPIWRYAVENNIPIMSHCIMGTIYYRGDIKEKWHFHPVFQDKFGKDDWAKKLLPQSKNVDFQRNFTHPLNYLCLLEEDFLRTVILNPEKDSTSRVQEAFGYYKEGDTFDCNLANLKICLAHYGGEEEWIRYMEQDRVTYSQRLMRDPLEGLKFMTNTDNDFSWNKLNQLWHDADWYSIISSLLIRYENMYADLSYILSKPAIYPLLHYTLQKGDNYPAERSSYLGELDFHKKGKHYTGKNKLRSRVLFGTDFYVVRNHKSDKNLFINLQTLLGEEKFDLIARENTHNYLMRN